MKWLLLLLITVNIILFVVQIKSQGDKGVVGNFHGVVGAQNIQLLNASVDDGRERCVVIGAIQDDQALVEVIDYLNGQSVGFDIVEKEFDLAPSYWVYVNGELGEGTQKRLSELKVDSYLIASGELKGMLSLGLFANIDLAQNMVNSLMRSGINASLHEKTKTKKTKWVSFKSNGSDADKLVVDALVSMKINLGEIKEFFCKSVASEK